MNSAKTTEDLAHGYIQTLLPSIQQKIRELPTSKVNVDKVVRITLTALDKIVRTIIAADINQFKQLCDKEGITVLSQKALIDYCYLIFSTSAKYNLRTNIVESLEKSLQTSSLTNDYTSYKNDFTDEEEEEDTKYCSRCGAKNILGSTFCSTCGETII